jgi:hypothetical protein
LGNYLVQPQYHSDVQEFLDQLLAQPHLSIVGGYHNSNLSDVVAGLEPAAVLGGIGNYLVSG